MKKLLFVINSLKHKSGIERVACQLGELFSAELDYEVTILSRDTGILNVAYPISMSRVISLGENYISFLVNLQKFILKEKPDYILVHNMGRLTLLSSILYRSNIKLISLEHVAFNARPSWVRLLSGLLYRRVDKVITLTKHDLNNYLSWNRSCDIIHNISPFEVSDSKSYLCRKIIAVGRLTYQKNFLSLLEAWSIIYPFTMDWSLDIYGIGEEYDMLLDFIEKNKLHNVTLRGEVIDIEKVYRNSDFLVMSSRFEGLPMVLIEAQCFGLPIVSYDCPYGPSEIIEDNVNGILVENQNVRLLANSILDLINNPCKIKKLSEQAISASKRFQKDNILDKWKEVFS